MVANRLVAVCRASGILAQSVSFFTLYEYFVIFVAGFHKSYVWTPALNKVIIINNKYRFLKIWEYYRRCNLTHIQVFNRSKEQTNYFKLWSVLAVDTA